MHPLDLFATIREETPFPEEIIGIMLSYCYGRLYVDDSLLEPVGDNQQEGEPYMYRSVSGRNYGLYITFDHSSHANRFFLQGSYQGYNKTIYDPFPRRDYGEPLRNYINRVEKQGQIPNKVVGFITEKVFYTFRALRREFDDLQLSLNIITGDAINLDKLYSKGRRNNVKAGVLETRLLVSSDLYDCAWTIDDKTGLDDDVDCQCSLYTTRRNTEWIVGSKRYMCQFCRKSHSKYIADVPCASMEGFETVRGRRLVLKDSTKYSWYYNHDVEFQPLGIDWCGSSYLTSHHTSKPNGRKRLDATRLIGCK